MNKVYLVTSSQYLGLGKFNTVAMMTKSDSRLNALTEFLRQYAKVGAQATLASSHASPTGRAGAKTDTAKAALQEGVHKTYEIEDFLVLNTTADSDFLVLGGESRSLENPLEIQVQEEPFDVPVNITRKTRASL